MSNAPSLIPVTAMIFTLNEEMHLPSCLASLKDFSEVIVVDSYSNDATEQVSREAGAGFYQHKFEGFGSQRNWAFDHVPIKNDWVLILDADERVASGLSREIQQVLSNVGSEMGAFRVRRRFYMWGRWLRYSSLYPTWVVRLIHRDKVRYINRGHAETQQVDGEIGNLQNDLIDENLKGMDEWFERQNRYSRKDAEYELAQQGNTLKPGDLFSSEPLVRRAAMKRLALRLPARPMLYFLYSYVWKRGFLDGRDGLVFCLMKALYQRMVVIKKYDIRRLEESK